MKLSLGAPHPAGGVRRLNADIGVLGGTGAAGSALAVRLASVGFTVVIGSGSIDRAAEACADTKAAWPEHRLRLTPGSNASAAAADVVVLASPWADAVEAAVEVAELVEGKVVLATTSAHDRATGEYRPVRLRLGSIAEEIQAAVPGAKVVAAMTHLPTERLRDISRPIGGDVLVCSNDSEASATVAWIVETIPVLRAFDVGSLAQASGLDAVAALLKQVQSHGTSEVTMHLFGAFHQPRCD